MAEEFRILLGAELKSGELDNIRTQINNIQVNPITLAMNTKNVRNQINSIRTQIKNLSNIRINLTGGNGNTGVQKTVTDVTRAYNDLMNLQRRINSIRIQIGGLDTNKNSSQISILSGQLNRLMTDYNNLYQTFNRDFSTNQIDNLSRAFEVASGKVSALNAKMADTTATKQTEEAYRELYNTAKKIDSLELKIRGLNSDKNSQEAEELLLQLNNIRQTYQQLSTDLNGQLSSSQLSNLSAATYDTQDKLRQLDAKVADTKRRLADGINVKFDNGTFSNEINKITTNLSKINHQSDEVVASMQELNNAFAAMHTAKSLNDVDKLISSYDRYQIALKNVKNQIEINQRVEQQNINASKLTSAKQALSSQMDVWLKNNSAAAKQFGGQIEALKAKLNSCDAVQLDGIKSEFKEITRQAELAGKATQTFGDRLKTQMSKLSTYFSATMLITESIQAMRAMYNNVVDVDTAMTGLYRVTDLTSTQYDKLYDNMISSAKKYGSTLTDIINSTSDWVRLGFDANQANQLAEVSSMYQHISDLDYGVAVENLVTAYKGYQNQLSNLYNGDEVAAIRYIADIFNELGNKYAVSAEDIGSALTRSASALDLAGNTIQQSAAMITGITEVTQDHEKAGSALKVLSLRLRGMKGELEELGEDVDENVESLSKMQTQVLNLTNGKVNIFNDDGSFKSTYEMMDAIADIYYDLSATDQADLLETIAGKNRANDVAALITNWNQVEKAMKSAMEAEGSATTENAKYMESIQGRLDALTASWQALSNTVVNSDFVKVLLDDLTDLVDTLDFVIDKVGLLPTLLTTIAGVSAFKGNFGFFNTFNTELDGVTNKLGIFRKSFNDIIRDVKSGQGISTALFSNIKYKDGITKNDVDCISNFMTQIKNGVPTAKAWSDTMTGATVAGKKMAVQVKSGAVELSTLTATANTSKVAMFGLKVASTALNMALTMGLSIAIQALVTGLNNLIHAAKIASEKADELKNQSMQTAEAINEECKQLDELIDKYKELAKSDNQDASTRIEIKNIQGDIVDLVGQQAKNLDLVNGKLDDELEKLLLIRAEEAKKAVESNTSAYHNAKNSADKAIGGDSALGMDGYAYVSDGWWNTDKEAAEVLRKNGYSKQVNFGGIANSHLFVTDVLDEDGNYIEGAIKKSELLQRMIDTLKENYSDYASTDLYQGLVEQRDAYLKYADDITIAAQQLTDSIIIASEYDNELMKINVDSVETFGDYRDKLIELVQNSPDLAEAILNGDVTKEYIEQSVTSYLSTIQQFSDYYNKWVADINGSSDKEVEIPKISFSDLIADTDKDNDFIDIVDTYIEKVNTLQEAFKSFKDGDFTKADFVELVKIFPELADNADDLDVAIANLLGEMNTDITSDFADQFGKLKTEEDVVALQNFQDAVLELGQIVGDTAISIDISAESEGMESLFTAMKESVSSTGLTAESIKNLKARYQDLENYDAARLFERTSNGIHLNTKALRELESEYEKQKKAKINVDLQELVDQYNNLTKEIDNTSDAAKKAELYAKRADIQDQINDTAELAAMYEGLTSVFYKWEQAQSIGEEGDMYDSLAGSLENIKKLYEEGLIGTNKFRTAVQLMSNEDLSNASIDELLAAYDSGYSKMTRYFADSSNGCLNFLNDVQKLNTEWVKMNSDGSWDINFGVGNDKEIAEALGINVESVQAIMRKLSDYGFDINLDSIYTSLGFLQSETEKAVEVVNKALENIGRTPVNFNFDTTDINEIETQIKEAQTVLNIFKNTDGTVNLNAEGAEESQQILVTLISYKQQLNAPSVMSVDTSKAENDINNVISLLQDYQTNYNDIEINTAVGADTTEAQTNIQTILNQLNNMPDDVKTKLGLDDTGFQSALEELTSTEVDVKAGVNLDTDALDAVVGYINSITPEMMVEAGLDASQIDGYTPPEKDGEVKYTVDDSAVQNWTAPVKTGEVIYYASINSWTVPTRYGTVVYTAKMSGNSDASGTAHANGTTFAHGTIGRAFKRGDWGTKDSGIALGGELGQELVVRDGRFFTIGDNSAEFFKYKKGDIIFNAEQTKQIFQNGKISSGSRRGNAFVNGTAFVEGNAFSGGSGSIIVNGSVVTNSSNDSSNNDDNVDDFKETFDWIEVAIDRIERAISSLDLKANSVYKSWGNRNSSLKDQITEIGNEIKLQEEGYKRYLEQADSVGLSEDWAKLVRDGEIDISTVTDKDLAERIKEYQEWYEKALDCKDAIDELGESLAECYQTAFDNVIAQYDGILSIIGHEKSMLDEYIAQSEAKGYVTSSKYYEALIENEQDNISQLNNEKNELLAKLEEGLASGAIEEGSEAWYEMVNQIDEVTLAIEQGNTAILEYTNSIRDIEWELFDILQSQISQITDEADFLINLLSNDKLYDDRGQLTNEGMATMGLHGQNYNVYMAQAEEYAQEILKIDEEIANDPYNQDLLERRQELLELQRENILAAEDEKQAIVDMVKEGIELELDYMQKLIDTYSDALDAQKDLYDYQKKVSEQTKKIADLEKQISAYAGDTSEEAKAKIQQIKVSLKETKINLEETEYEKYISDQKKLMDDLYLEYEIILNQRLDNVDGLLSDMIESINNNATTINSTLTTEATNVGYTISEAMNSIWNTGSDNMKTVLTTINGSIISSTTTIASAIGTMKSNYESVIADLNSKASSNVSSASSSSSSNSSQDNTSSNGSSSSSYKSTTTSSSTSTTTNKSTTTKTTTSKSNTTNSNENVLTEKDYNGVALAIINGNQGWGTGSTRTERLEEAGFDANKVQSTVNQMMKDGYVNSGEWVGKYDGITSVNDYNYKNYNVGKRKFLDDEIAWTQDGGAEMIVRPSDGAILTPIARFDSVLSHAASGNIWGMANNPSEFIRDNLKLDGVDTPIGYGGNTNYTQNLEQVVFNLPNVKNYDELLEALKDDKNFERLIMAMTIDQMAGRTSLAKRKSIR